MENLSNNSAVLDRLTVVEPFGQQKTIKVRSLVSRLAEEMGDCWRNGDRRLAEEFLAHPRLANKLEPALELINEEVCLRQEAGETVDLCDYLHRFPQWNLEVRALFDCHDFVERKLHGPVFPQVGESLGDFRLQSELGRGALGRVFLATQSSLADRPVVLKVTPSTCDEHLALARVQHTHIVPLLSVVNDPARRVTALCMPYFGGQTLEQLLQRMEALPFSERNGRQMLELLEREQAKVPMALPATDPARRFLTRATYEQAICWIGACMAEALQYAHDRGLVHLDLKPSNMLLTADGQPMLLDFHLARQPIQAGDDPRRFGGTPLYMSPEQRTALTESSEGRNISVVVDGRSDVYSLGLVLYEALGGTVPDDPAATPAPLREQNPHVSVSLSDLLAKCLATDSRDRYGDAESLAADLWRQLKSQPLEGVANRSAVERWRKWRRRHPQAFRLLGAAVILIVGGVVWGSIALNHRDQRPRADTTLSERRQPSKTARQLHMLADQFRLLCDADSLTAADRQTLADSCRSLWSQRKTLARQLGSHPELKQQCHDDLLDMALLWTDFQVSSASRQQRDAARQEALRVIGEAEAMFGPAPVLAYKQHLHAQALGLSDLSKSASRRLAELPLRTAWDHYALGRALLQSGELQEAWIHLDQAVRKQPQEFWPSFYRAICAYQTGRYTDAVVDLTKCITLRPDLAGCYYNRASAYTKLDCTDRALQDYDRVLELEPKYAMAALNRGVLHYHENRLVEATADLQASIDLGADPSAAYYNLALVKLAQHNRSDAVECLQLCLQHDPSNHEARRQLDRLLAVGGTP